MNSNYENNQDDSSEYSRGGKAREESAASRRRPSHTRAGRPAVHNGIHRRRNKRFSW